MKFTPLFIFVFLLSLVISLSFPGISIATTRKGKVFVQNAPRKTIKKANLPPAPYHKWAHHHWVWLNQFMSNQTSMIELVQG